MRTRSIMKWLGHSSYGRVTVGPRMNCGKVWGSWERHGGLGGHALPYLFVAHAGERLVSVVQGPGLEPVGDE